MWWRVGQLRSTTKSALVSVVGFVVGSVSFREMRDEGGAEEGGRRGRGRVGGPTTDKTAGALDLPMPITAMTKPSHVNAAVVSSQSLRA